MGPSQPPPPPVVKTPTPLRRKRPAPEPLQVTARVDGTDVAAPWPTVRPSWLKLSVTGGSSTALVMMVVTAWLARSPLLVVLLFLTLAMLCAAWFAWPTVMAARAPRSLTLHAHKLTWRGHDVNWSEITHISLQPYARFSASYVRCVEIRCSDGTHMHIAWGLEMPALEWLLTEIKRARRASRAAEGALDNAALDDIDKLLGSSRT